MTHSDRDGSELNRFTSPQETIEATPAPQGTGEAFIHAETARIESRQVCAKCNQDWGLFHKGCDGEWVTEFRIVTPWHRSADSAAPAGLPLHESADRDADNVPTFEQILADPSYDAGPVTVRLCDDDGTVRSGMFHSGTDYACTGSAFDMRHRLICNNPIHQVGDADNVPSDAECSCAMTESSMRACEVHGEKASEETLAAWEAKQRGDNVPSVEKCPRCSGTRLTRWGDTIGPCPECASLTLIRVDEHGRHVWVEILPETLGGEAQAATYEPCEAYNAPSDRERAYAEAILPFFGDNITAQHSRELRDFHATRIARACVAVEERRTAALRDRLARVEAVRESAKARMQLVLDRREATKGTGRHAVGLRNIDTGEALTLQRLIDHLDAALRGPEPTGDGA